MLIIFAWSEIAGHLTDSPAWRAWHLQSAKVWDVL